MIRWGSNIDKGHCCPACPKSYDKFIPAPFLLKFTLMIMCDRDLGVKHDTEYVANSTALSYQTEMIDDEGMGH